jgi:predicted membrane metal-binding protein
MAVAIVHFLWNPEAPASLSFQLSYTAVFAILIALRGTGYDRMMLSFSMEAPSKKTKASKRLSKVLVPLHISLAAWSATLPIVQFHFGGSSPYFLIGNLLFVPLFTLVIWLTAAQLFLHPWLPDSVAETTDILVHQILTYMQKVLWILGEGAWLGL